MNTSPIPVTSKPKYNYSAKLNLLKFTNAAVINLKGRTETKRCIAIPIDDNYITMGAKGCYLNVQVLLLKNGGNNFGQTHCLKIEVPQEVYQSMTVEERNAVPVIGGMMPFVPAGEQDCKTYIADPDSDIPF